MKDSTLYCILCVIVAIFCIFLGWKMIFSKSDITAEPEPSIENQVEETKNQIVEAPKNEVTAPKNETATSSDTKREDNVFYTQVRKYEGKRKASEIHNLLESIRNSNLVADFKIHVEYKGEDRTEDVYELKSEIENGKTYEVQFEYQDNGQEIPKVIIR